MLIGVGGVDKLSRAEPPTGAHFARSLERLCFVGPLPLRVPFVVVRLSFCVVLGPPAGHWTARFV